MDRLKKILGHTVIIVESPSKAKTINGYLGKGYTVLASIGHIRDLPSKNGSVNPEDNFSMVWQLSDRSRDVLKNMEQALRGCTTLLLATDPDREGEAISWHVHEVLKDKNLIEGMDVQRIVFHEITKKAVEKAVKNPRPINQELVDAYLARRALDYLVGFSLSPILWRKLPGARSAGRVQSVALRLIVDREQEIEAFKAREYWTIDGLFQGDTPLQINNESQKNNPFKAKLVVVDGKKLDKFDIKTQEDAFVIKKRLETCHFSVASVEKKQVQRHPAAPFITSTLQQEASRKLGFSASKTMMLAQRLYEGVSIGGEVVGLITYMRTDGTNIADEAVISIREHIQQHFGGEYLPGQPRTYKTKVKNAQEAHEAIRPTSITRGGDSVAAYLESDQLALYTLIWKRALACQMQSAKFDQVTIEITSNKSEGFGFRAVGTTLVFDGFLRLYQEGTDDPQDEEGNGYLPPLSPSQLLIANDIVPAQHFTQPPPRFSEASLLKKMEEVGIGRPSTSAPILHLLQDRGYVQMEKRCFIPQIRGRLVISFLKHYFSQYVTYDFTAHMEEQLDEISNGSLQWKQVLNDFWQPFIQTITNAQELKITDVVDFLQEDLTSFLFGTVSEEKTMCPHCNEGTLNLKLGKYGAFLGCSTYPICNYIKNIGAETEAAGGANTLITESVTIGMDPTTNQQIVLKNGRYGYYLEWDGDAAQLPLIPEEEVKGIDESKIDETDLVIAEETIATDTKGKKKKAPPKKKKAAKPVKPVKVKKKTVGIPAGIDPSNIDLPLALRLGSLPFQLGLYPKDNQVLSVGNGRFGPYIKYGNTFTSIPKTYSFLDLTIEQAIDILEKKLAKPKTTGRKPASKKSIKKDNTEAP